MPWEYVIEPGRRLITVRIWGQVRVADFLEAPAASERQDSGMVSCRCCSSFFSFATSGSASGSHDPGLSRHRFRGINFMNR